MVTKTVEEMDKSMAKRSGQYHQKADGCHEASRCPDAGMQQTEESAASLAEHSGWE